VKNIMGVEYTIVDVPPKLVPVDENPFMPMVLDVIKNKKAAQFVITKPENGTLADELDKTLKLIRVATRAKDMTAKFDVKGDAKTAESVTVVFHVGPKISRPRKNASAANGTPATADATPTADAATADAATEPNVVPGEVTPDSGTPDEAKPDESAPVDVPAEPTPDSPERTPETTPEAPKRGRFARTSR
jgi:hypothetical protein